MVPARGGSKRLPGKNVRLLGGKPLIAWTLDTAHRSDCLVDVVVSTDDPAIAAAAASFGATVPGLRPHFLATDEAGSADVAIHALDVWESAQGAVDGVMLLQPTSPFRSIETIQRAVATFGDQGFHPLVGVSPAESHPAWCFSVAEQGSLQPFLAMGNTFARSQELPAAYAVNGAMYLISPKDLRRERSFLPAGAKALIMDNPAETLDIDTAWDWMIAEAIVEHQLYPSVLL
nr:acylneuraminate cytidylyltransferase family protein [Azonexus sp. R2A61]